MQREALFSTGSMPAQEKYGHPLRGWRLMDKDNSNTCNWLLGEGWNVVELCFEVGPPSVYSEDSVIL